ncbi:MAG TPA: hypothetical protein VF065_08465, partial [Ilumatobacter sp.]
APIASIISPPDGYQRPAGRLVELRGSAIDPEDQATTIRWTSDRDGELGTGTALGVTNLSEGTHRITMIAVDTAGNRSEQAIEVIAGTTDLSPPELTDEVADLLTRGIPTTDRDGNRGTSRDWTRIALIAALTISIGLSALVVRDRRTARTSRAAPTPDAPEVE